MISGLAVHLADTPVGVLYRFEDEAYRFSFDPRWLQEPQRPILGQLSEDRRPNPIETSGLPCWFAHLLPQGPLRRLLARQAQVLDDDDFDLLSACGEDLPGAVRLTPADAQLEELGLASPPRPLALAAPSTSGFRFSLAGNQWKMSARKDERGLVIPVQGELGTWIAKFQDPTHAELPRVEYATSQWARAAGIAIPVTRLVDLDEFTELPAALPTAEPRAFLIERFDRASSSPGDPHATRRIHAEDFGQILDRPPGTRQNDGDYVELAAQLHYLAPQDLPAFLAQLVFCVLSGNGDAHLKNWSVIYPDGRHARLSPAYDLVPTILYYPKDQLALPLAGTADFFAVDEASFVRLAAACQLSSSEVLPAVAESVARVLDAWHRERSAWPFTKDEAQRIDSHVAALPLCRLKT